MSKKKDDLPAQPWYWGDWFKATDIMSLPRDTRDVWHFMIGRMWESEERGYLTIAGRKPTDEELCAVLGFGNIEGVNHTLNPTLKGGVIQEMRRHLDILAEKKIYSIDDRGIIYCRRMVRDQLKREKSIEYGKKGGNPNLKIGLTLPLTRGLTPPEDENEIENEGELVATREEATKQDNAATSEGDSKGEKAETWKTSFAIYQAEEAAAYAALIADKEFLEKEESVKKYPDLNILKTMEKAHMYWCEEKAWKRKRKEKTININWGVTYHNALTQPMNHVFNGKTKPLSHYQIEIDAAIKRENEWRAKL
jgi:hypothetical protein